MTVSFRVSPVMSYCGNPKFFVRCSLCKISTVATSYCSLHPPPAALANVSTSIQFRVLSYKKHYNIFLHVCQEVFQKVCQ